MAAVHLLYNSPDVMPAIQTQHLPGVGQTTQKLNSHSPANFLYKPWYPGGLFGAFYRGYSIEENSRGSL